MIRGDFKMKLDLRRPEGVEFHVPPLRQSRRTERSHSRRPAVAPFVVGGIAISGFVYLLTQLSAVAVMVILGAILLAIAGLVGVVAWGLDNTPW